MTLGQRLAFYRKKSCLTQQQLGRMINVSAQAVSKWENDQAEPDVATICKLSEIYHISTDALLTGRDCTPDTTSEQKHARPKSHPHLRTLILTLVIFLIAAVAACTLINIFINKMAMSTLPCESMGQILTGVSPIQYI